MKVEDLFVPAGKCALDFLTEMEEWEWIKNS